MRLLTLAVCSAILALGACAPVEEEPKASGFVIGDAKEYEDGEYEDRYFNYFQDTRTNLCFAGGRLGYGEGVLTTVPCTPEVLALVRSSGVRQSTQVPTEATVR